MFLAPTKLNEGRVVVDRLEYAGHVYYGGPLFFPDGTTAAVVRTQDITESSWQQTNSSGGESVPYSVQSSLKTSTVAVVVAAASGGGVVRAKL